MFSVEPAVQMWATFALIAAALVSFARERWPIELTSLSVIAAPFVPEMAQRLRAMLNLKDRKPGPLLPAETLPAGHELGEVSVLVEKIDDEVIAEEIARLRG